MVWPSGGSTFQARGLSIAKGTVPGVGQSEERGEQNERHREVAGPLHAELQRPV